ncbi:MAG: 2-phosphosulfolactate phosphatase [Bacteroidales bacterium]|nr:2-phosphosulfolactate phosphatase [Bacteroidales bacterium]
MEINILQLLDGAKKAEGFTVIIDVFRAFSVAPYLVSLGVKKIIPAGKIEDAYSLASSFENSILIGERNEKKPEGFLYGNSPSQIEKEMVTNKIVIHTTSSGTQGIVNAKNAERIFTGSFVNANAIIKFIKKENPAKVSLCCMGYSLQKKLKKIHFVQNILKQVYKIDFLIFKVPLMKLEILQEKDFLFRKIKNFHRRATSIFA